MINQSPAPTHNPLYNRLGEILAEKNMRYKELAEKAHLSVRTVSNIIHERVESVDLSVLARICQVLGIQPGEIFFVELSTVWTRARKIGEVLTHIASGVCPHCAGSSAAGTVDGFRETCGRWDVMAAHEIADLVAHQTGIKVEEHMHSNSGFPTSTLQAGIRHFVHDGRVHVILGSPASNRLAEEVIAQEIYNVPAGSTAQLKSFPFALVSPTGRVVSAFNCDGELDACGIIDTRTGKLVARRTFSQNGGDGRDCALLVICRTAPTPLNLNNPSEGEGLIICCCGHSGPATLACTRVLADPRYAAELFPSEVGKPIMRVVTATYSRSDSTKLADIRALTGYELLPAPAGDDTWNTGPAPLHGVG